MALREFRDSKGVLWKVWSVTPDSLDKRTTAEDYMRDWQDGWLCFECPESRRRLATFPPGWEELRDDELESLLSKAQPVKRRGTDDLIRDYRRNTGESETVAAAPAAEIPAPPQPRPDAGRVTPVSTPAATHTRIFTDARGRKFVAGLYRVAPRADSGTGGRAPTSPGTVLRFISGSIVLDLEEWPDDWDRYTDTQLARLLERAQLADTAAVAESLPLRRQTDIPG